MAAATGIIDSARLTTPLKPLDPGDLGADPANPPPADPSAGTGTAYPKPLAVTDPATGNPNALAAQPGAPVTLPGTPNSSPTASPLAAPGLAPTATADPLVSDPAAVTTGAPATSTSTSTSTAGASSSGPTGTGSTNPLSWSPTNGIIDDIRGITPKNVDGQGYTSGGVATTPDATSQGYDAQGYTAQQGTAVTSDENVSSAVDRIIDQNSPLMQRERAKAMDTANDRGLLNSTMAAQSGEAAVLDKASELAAGDVQNAQFNAQEKNVMTINNVNQANTAAAFHADAMNQAAQFAAAAKNSVSQFNGAQAQQRALAAAQLWDQAQQFSAAAKQAAESFNADAYNKAMQSYVDAKNAATAAQNDAENLSRRDTAQINAGITQANIGAKATVDAAAAHAAGMVGAAQISASASAANTAASIAAQEKMQGNALSEDMAKYNLGLNQQQQQWATGLSATQFNNFQSGYTNIMTSQLEPDAKNNALNNYMSMWTASGTLPFDINVPKGP
jgi:hypothetical protein